MEKVQVIVGPTSSGKTSSAIKLCEKFGKENCAIISADSRQIIKEMDIGTGKLPIGSNFHLARTDSESDKWTVNGVDIYGYDLATPLDYFTVYDYAVYARNKLSMLLSRGKKVFIVGGTGFYIDVLTGRQSLDSKAPDLAMRKELEALSLDALLNRLEKLNPETLHKLDTNNPIRVIRALENELSTKIVPDLPALPKIAFEYIGLRAENNYLFNKVDGWLGYVWAHGLVDETASLKTKYPTSLKLKGLVYKSVLAYLEGSLNEDIAKERAKFDLHAYIRRQLTWFKRNNAIKWFDISKPFSL